MGGRGVREVLIELLRSWQLPHKLNGGGFTGHGPPQLPVHRSEWKFIFPTGHISFTIRLDSMLKLIRNYINPIRLTVPMDLRAISLLKYCPLHLAGGIPVLTHLSKCHS
jgi:hypothetical protein